jgi:hypothetical protein
MTDATPGLSWATRIQGDRPTAFDTAAHRGRTVIERGICDLEEWCGSATCYLPPATCHDKLATPRLATPRQNCQLPRRRHPPHHRHLDRMLIEHALGAVQARGRFQHQ